jgi:hypothetical protein
MPRHDVCSGRCYQCQGEGKRGAEDDWETGSVFRAQSDESGTYLDMHTGHASIQAQFGLSRAKNFGWGGCACSLGPPYSFVR